MAETPVKHPGVAGNNGQSDGHPGGLLDLLHTPRYVREAYAYEYLSRSSGGTSGWLDGRLLSGRPLRLHDSMSAGVCVFVCECVCVCVSGS